MKQVPLLAMLILAGACATPGLDYDARLPAGSLAAAEYRSVEVGGFSGPDGGWYSDQFEEMLATATLDGRPWFDLYGAGDGPSGLYVGRISIDDVEHEVYEDTVRKCVEWDGLFDCERREDVLQVCVDTRVDVSVYPELIDRRTDEIVFAGRYSGSASDSECEDAGYGGPARLFGQWDPPADLVREALADTLAPARQDVAPRNAVVRAPLVDEALDPMARADPRFGQAVEAAKSGDRAGACGMWSDLAGEFPAAPAVLHNLGACAEADGDYEQAQALYGEAASLASSYSGDRDGAVKRILQSLERISERRVDETVLDYLDGERAPPPETGDEFSSPEGLDGTG